jgi:hypothetical protein
MIYSACCMPSPTNMHGCIRNWTLYTIYAMEQSTSSSWNWLFTVDICMVTSEKQDSLSVNMIALIFITRSQPTT